MTPWGGSLTVDLEDSIGRAVWLHGLYEIVVCETLWRLVDSGDVCVDAGANVGQMTSLLSARSGPQGEVIAFEPHPVTFESLRRNCEEIPPDWAPIRLHCCALHADSCRLSLVEPEGFTHDSGLARVELVSPGALSVPAVALDNAWGAQPPSIAILKLDVEGHEMEVLKGAISLLRQHAIRDVVFEDHTLGATGTVRLLQDNGYAVFRVCRGRHGPTLHAPAQAPDCAWEPPVFVATADEARALQRLQLAGWSIFSADRAKPAADRPPSGRLPQIRGSR